MICVVVVIVVVMGIYIYIYGSFPGGIENGIEY